MVYSDTDYILDEPADTYLVQAVYGKATESVES